MSKKWIVYMVSFAMMSFLWAEDENKTIYYPKKEEVPKGQSHELFESDREKGLTSNPGFLSKKGVQEFTAVLGMKKGNIEKIFYAAVGKERESFGYIVFSCKNKEVVNKITEKIKRMTNESRFAFTNGNDVVLFGCDKPKYQKPLAQWSKQLQERLLKDHKIKLIPVSKEKKKDTAKKEKTKKDPIWLTSIEKGRKEAKLTGRSLLVKIGADW